MICEYNPKFCIGERVIMRFPKENMGRNSDYKTGLGLLNFFKDMDGMEFEIANMSPSKNWHYDIFPDCPDMRCLYQLRGGFTDRNGLYQSVEGCVYEEYWFEPAKEMAVDEGVDFF